MTDVDEYGLTYYQRDSVEELSRVLGGSDAMWQYAYEVVTRGLPLGDARREVESLKVTGARRASRHTEESLASHYRIPLELCTHEYLTARWVNQ